MKVFVRLFLKITGLIPYWIYLKPRFYFESRKAKKEYKKNKGAVLICNHISSMDYYVFLYKYFFNIVHTMVGDNIYNYGLMNMVNKSLGNIKVERGSPSNFLAIKKAMEYVKKGKYVLIFPEAHFEKTPGEIQDISLGAIKVAYETNKPIIPFYCNGGYGFKKRAKYICGEKIYLRDYINKTELTNEDYEYLRKIVRNKMVSLKSTLTAMVTYKTRNRLSPKFYAYNMGIVLSLPWYMIFPLKKIYLCDKKELKELLGKNCLIAANHCDFLDPLGMLLAFPSKMVRIIAQEELWRGKIFSHLMDHLGTIKYRKYSMNRMDVRCFFEARGILDGKGIVGIFPQGKIIKDGTFEKTILGGVAMLSLMTNSPIIPYMFLNRYRALKITHVIIGKPIYPDNFLVDGSFKKEKMNDYLEYIYEKMNETLKIGLKKIGKTKIN